MNLSYFVIIPYFFLIFIGLTLPSDGQHGLLNPKSLAYLASLISLVIPIFHAKKLSKLTKNLLIFLAATFSFLIAWLLIGAIRGDTPLSTEVDQMKIIIITVSIPVITLFLIDSNFLTPVQFFRAVIYSSFAYIFIKCALVALHLAGAFNIWSFIEFTGFRTMRMNITDGLNRLQTSSDVFTPFILLFVLQAERLKVSLSNWFRNSYIILALFSTFLSFSRYLIAIYIMSLILYWFTLNAKKTFLNAIFALSLLVPAVYFIGPAKVQKVIELRVFSKSTRVSDSIREAQVQAMAHEIEDAPLFGHGLGAYAKENIRDTKLRYSYEVQWVAFLMQFGLIGLFLIIIPIIVIGYRILNAPLSSTRFAFFILYVLWILSGLTNPFLLSLASGILFTCFILIPRALKTDCDKSCPSLTIQTSPK